MFKERVISGFVLCVFVFSCFYLGSFSLAAMLIFVSVAGYNELTKAMKVDFKERIWGMIIASLMYVGLFFVTDFYVIAVALLAEVLTELSLFVIKYPKVSLESTLSKVFSFVYAPVLFSFIYFIRESSIGLEMIWLILLSSWLCDTMAYCVGMLIGKKKIFPQLSPKKSLEGCIGGVAGAGIGGLLYGILYLEKLMPGYNIWIYTTIGCMICSIFSMIGDLAASAIKRQTGIKDYSRLIPGHGGIMDRFDSVLFVAPVCFLVTKIIELIIA